MIDCTQIHYNKRAFNREEIMEHLNAFKKHLDVVDEHYISSHMTAKISHFWVTYRDPDNNWYSKSYLAKLDEEATEFCGKAESNNFLFVHGTSFYDMYLKDLLSSYSIERNHEEYSEQDLQRSQEALQEWKNRVINDYWRKEHIRRLVWELEKYYVAECWEQIEKLAKAILCPDESIDFRTMDEHGCVIELLPGVKSYDSSVCNYRAKICSIHGLFGGYAHYSNTRIKPKLRNEEMVVIPGVIYTRGKGNLTIVEIGEGIFESLDKAKIIRIPHCIENLAWSFWHCRNLERIEVISQSQYRYDCIKDIDGVLYNAELTELLAYPNMHGKVYEVPEGVKTIRSKAFKDCDNIEELILPSTLEKIGLNAFYRCINLKRIIVNQPKGKLVYEGLFGEFGFVNPKWYWIE